MIIKWNENSDFSPDGETFSIEHQVIAQKVGINCNNPDFNLGGGFISIHDEAGYPLMIRDQDETGVIFNEAKYHTQFGLMNDFGGIATTSIRLYGVTDPSAVNVCLVVTPYTDPILSGAKNDLGVIKEQSEALEGLIEQLCNSI